MVSKAIKKAKKKPVSKSSSITRQKAIKEKLKRKNQSAKKRIVRPKKPVSISKRKPAPKTRNMMDKCCRNIDLSKWNLKQVKWKRKPFYVVKYGTFFHIPLGIGKAMVQGMETAVKKYHTPQPDFWLSKDTGLFSAKMMFSVERASSSDPDIEELTGTFVARGFQGPYKNMGNFIRVFIEQVQQKFKKKPTELLFWYVNCPKCAKKQGGPKIVIFGKI